MSGWPGHQVRKRDTSLRDAYRAVFLTSPSGREVLDDILRHCSYWSTIDPESPAQAALSNLGKLIMARLGIVTEDNTEAIIMALGNIPLKD